MNETRTSLLDAKYSCDGLMERSSRKRTTFELEFAIKAFQSLLLVNALSQSVRKVRFHNELLFELYHKPGHNWQTMKNAWPVFMFHRLVF